jgi:hypothetical protein
MLAARRNGVTQRTHGKGSAVHAQRSRFLTLEVSRENSKGNQCVKKVAYIRGIRRVLKSKKEALREESTLVTDLLRKKPCMKFNNLILTKCS